MTEKLKRDPNRHRFKEESNGELFQIELDSLQFKDLVVTVNSYYDKNIHEENLGEFTPEKITAYVNKRLNS